MRTIRRALTRQLLAGFTALLVLGGVSVFLLIRDELVEQFDVALRAKAMAIATVTSERDGRVEIDSSDRFMREFDAPGSSPDQFALDDDSAEGGPEAPGFFQLWLADGKPIARSESLGAADLPLRFGPLDHPSFWNLGLPAGHAGRAVGLAFRARAIGRLATTAEDEAGLAPAASVVLVVASDRGGLDRALAALAEWTSP